MSLRTVAPVRATLLHTAAVLLAGLTIALACNPARALGDARKGEYLMKAAGCMGCHTAEGPKSVPFAGGRALKTPFGTFYGPNITSHPTAGIGGWNEDNFLQAMRQGLRRDGSHYFPAFPYPSFTKMTDEDLKDLWAYMRTIPPSNRVNSQHELKFPFGFRPLVVVWKWLFFKPGPEPVAANLSAPQKRGAYLVTALGHCGECHTPRNFLGGPKKDRLLAGAKSGPDGKGVPNLTPEKLKKWGDGELKDFLVNGMNPDGDVPAEAMAEVVRNTTSQLTADDLAAMVAYLRSLPAVPDEK